MKRLVTLLAIFALVLPIMLIEGPLRAQSQMDDMTAQYPLNSFDQSGSQSLRPLQQARQPLLQNQVRMRGRVIVRISPSTPTVRERMLARLQRRASQRAYVEEPHDDCVNVEDIAGVAYSQDNRLLLFMRDRDVLAASLERSCSARAFYSGFYVERNEDGELCVARDRLQSRAGASCQLDELSRLVAVSD